MESIHTLFPWASIPDDGSGDTEISATVLADQWIAQHPLRPLVELSPLLTENTDVPAAVSASRKRRWLARFPEPLRASVADVSDIGGMGVSTVREVVILLVDAVLRNDIPTLLPLPAAAPVGFVDAVLGGAPEVSPDAGAEVAAHDAASGTDEDSSADDVYAQDTAYLAEDVEALVAAWCWQWAATGTTAADDAPDSVTALFADRVVTGVDWATNPAGFIAHRIRGEIAAAVPTPRDVEMAYLRFIAGKTLDQVGAHFDLTRERVRQIVTHTRKELRKSPYVGLLREAIVRRFPVVCRWEEVCAALPCLNEASGLQEASVGQILTALDDRWQVRDGWFVRADCAHTIAACAREVAARTALPGEELVAIVDPADIATTAGVDADDLVAYVTHLAKEVGGSPQTDIDDVIITQVGTQWLVTDSRPTKVDFAIAALMIAGTRLTLEEMADTVGQEMGRGVPQRLAEDPRLLRTSRIHWELAHWGGEPFTTIADWIGTHVDACGAVPIKELIEQAPQVEISPSSIYVYANADGFAVVDGMVVRSDAPKITTATPEDSSRLYWRDGHWQLLVTINHDHVRGSGFGVGPALAGLHGLAAGESMEFSSSDGPVTLGLARTASNTTVSTIRRFLEPLGLDEGDRVWISFHPTSHEFTISRATTRAEGLSGWADVANWMAMDDRTTALDGSTPDFRTVVNEALGLAADAPLRRTVSRLRRRRDNEQADALQALGSLPTTD